MSSLETLSSALAGRYTVERELGRGGMATVYLAEDLRHRRKVALKVLHPELGTAVGPERFLREIQVTAQLQHPHILTLHDSGEVAGLLYYVMPYVEGESLRGRLARERQLPVDDAIRIACDVADALDYAHRHNVLHRDVKPENVLLHDGRALVADFGIARAVVRASEPDSLTASGVAVGTPAYMSPEQAMGETTLDARSDIHALGAVTYEMVAGEPPYTAPTPQGVIARLMSDEPRPLRRTRPSVPAHVEAAVRRALAKLPADRFTSAHEFAAALQHPHPAVLPADAVGERTYDGTEALAPSRGSRDRVRLTVPWVVAAVALGISGWLASRPAATSSSVITRLSIDPPPGVRIDASTSLFGLSPDGTRIVFVGFASGSSRIYERALDELTVTPIPETDGGQQPFFSPDGEWMGFIGRRAPGPLKKLARGQRTAITISTSPNHRGTTWGSRDTIAYGQGDNPALRGIWVVSASGGKATRLTAPDTTRGELFHQDPQFLPNGRELLFAVTSGEARELAVASLDGRISRLNQEGTRAEYVPTGHLLYTTPDGTLMTRSFDLRTHRLSGPAVRLLDGIAVQVSGYSAWDVSPNGTLAYMRGSPLRRLVLVSRAGEIRPLSDEARRFDVPRVSPDGERIAVGVERERAADAGTIWIYEQGTFRLLTSISGRAIPIWTPDGKRIVFPRPAGSRGPDVYWQSADGSDAAEALFVEPGPQSPHELCRWNQAGLHRASNLPSGPGGYPMEAPAD